MYFYNVHSDLEIRQFGNTFECRESRLDAAKKHANKLIAKGQKVHIEELLPGTRCARMMKMEEWK